MQILLYLKRCEKECHSICTTICAVMWHKSFTDGSEARDAASYDVSMRKSFSFFSSSCVVTVSVLSHTLRWWCLFTDVSFTSFWQKCAVILACYPKGPFQSNLVKLAESLSHSSCTASRVKFHIYFIFAPHPCRCIVDKSLLIIYKHTNVSKTESINNCLFGNDSLKYLKFQWSTDGLR